MTGGHGMTGVMGMTGVIGVDIGGTSIKAASGDAPHDVRSTPTPHGEHAVVEVVAKLVAELRTPATAVVGVVVPGVVDTAQGVVRYATNLSWHDVPLRQLVHDALDVPCVIGHDVAAAGIAESAARPGERDLLFVAIGTGIAGAHVLDGEPVRGATGSAGEIGHVTVHPDGPRCACGRNGCLEVYASAPAIARSYDAARNTDGSDAATAAASATTAATVASLRASDPIAAQVWAAAVDALARALATATLLLDPGLIVLGGGLSAAGGTLTEPVCAALAETLAWRPAPRVETSLLGVDAGVHGALELARRALSGGARA